MRYLYALVAASALLWAGCGIEINENECTVDGDCARIKPGTICSQENWCVEPPAVLPDAGPQPDAGAGGEGGGAGGEGGGAGGEGGAADMTVEGDMGGAADMTVEGDMGGAADMAVEGDMGGAADMGAEADMSAEADMGADGGA